jgi:hypothetical protein
MGSGDNRRTRKMRKRVSQDKKKSALKLVISKSNAANKENNSDSKK